MKEEEKTQSLAAKLRRDLHLKKFKYPASSYQFKEKIEKIMGVNLKDLHKFLGSFDLIVEGRPILVHKIFYANFEEKISKTYQDFIKYEIAKIIPYPFYYQRIPTFRVGLPGNLFVGSFHKDSDFNHQGYEINFNLGLENYKQGEFMVETIPDSGEYKHMDCTYGEIFSFNHIDCTHGAEPNKSEETMVSFDFRIAIKEDYFHSENKSLTNKTQFIRGEYFSSDVYN